MTSVDRISEFYGLWPRDPSVPLSEWVMSVAGKYYSSPLSLETASRILGCTVAELQGILHLSYLDPERLERLNDNPPPSTTWFLFAEAQSEDEFAAGLAALEKIKPSESAFHAVLTAMAERAAPSVHERILALDSGCFWHLARKAKAYDVLTKKARGFLAQVARLKGQAEREGRLLEPSRKQLDWLVALLWELVDGGVIRADSPDNDQAYCDAVLAALGREGRHDTP